MTGQVLHVLRQYVLGKQVRSLHKDHNAFLSEGGVVAVVVLEFPKCRIRRRITRISRIRCGKVKRGWSSCGPLLPAGASRRRRGETGLNCHEVWPVILIPAEKAACHWRVSTRGMPSPGDKPIAIAQAYQDGFSKSPKGEPKRLRLRRFRTVEWISMSLHWP